MMKIKVKKSVLMIATLLLFAASFVACSSKEEGKEVASYKITFMNGDTILGTATVNENATLNQGDYSSYEAVPDTEFLGWYETPTFLESSKKDLATATFDKNVTLYGSFKSTNVKEDTRVWYLAGTSEKGLLKLSNWAGSEVADADKEQLILKPTGKTTNEFTITIDLFVGDQFQVIHDWAWEDQKGYGCFTTIDATQMESSGGIGGTADKSNISVLQDGNYTITLTTDPDNALQDTLSIVRNGDALTSPEVEEKAPYVVSENTEVNVKGSWVADWSDVKTLARTEGTSEFTITMELVADTELCFMIFDNGVDTGIVIKEENVKDDTSLALLTATGNNIKVAEAGCYTFLVDAKTQTVTITK